MDWNTRYKKYLESPTHIQEAYSGSETGKLLRSTAEAHHIPDNAYAPFAQLIGDVILGILSLERLPVQLQEAVGISPTDAEGVTTALKPFITEMHKTPPAQQEVADREEDTVSKPNITESPILQATRTMEKDIAEATDNEAPQWRTVEDAEDTVESPETAIPSYAKPLTDTPKYE
ncbi:hypothetical protein KTR10_00840 [Candidatus Kaiserbacteria bacterium]|nr:hypothetical protein [Candidatus Kaiserbacteria bacterium]